MVSKRRKTPSKRALAAAEAEEAAKRKPAKKKRGPKKKPKSAKKKKKVFMRPQRHSTIRAFSIHVRVQQIQLESGANVVQSVRETTDEQGESAEDLEHVNCGDVGRSTIANDSENASVVDAHHSKGRHDVTSELASI